MHCVTEFRVLAIGNAKLVFGKLLIGQEGTMSLAWRYRMQHIGNVKLPFGGTLGVKILTLMCLLNGMQYLRWITGCARTIITRVFFAR